VRAEPPATRGKPACISPLAPSPESRRRRAEQFRRTRRAEHAGPSRWALLVSIGANNSQHGVTVSVQ